ncbi:MAG: DUF5663 domain-containing protein [Minisyncoccia bacterium]
MQDELTTAIAANLGIADFPVEQQKQLIAQFGEVSLKAATISIVEKLTDDTREEFVKLAKAGDAVALKTFLDREVPDHEEIAKAAVAQEVERFKDFQKP